MPLLMRRAAITFGANTDHLNGFAAAAYVKNLSLIPFEVTEVKVESRHPEPKKIKIGDREALEVGGAFHFFAEEREEIGPLFLPRETRTYYLPTKFVDPILELVNSLTAANIKIVAYAGKDAVGEAPVGDLLPFLSMSRQAQAGEVRSTDSVKNMLDSLDVESRDRIQHTLNGLSKTPVNQRTNYPGLFDIDENLHLLSVPPDFKVLIRQFSSGGIQVVDVVRVPPLNFDDLLQGTVSAKE